MTCITGAGWTVRFAACGGVEIAHPDDNAAEPADAASALLARSTGQFCQRRLFIQPTPQAVAAIQPHWLCRPVTANHIHPESYPLRPVWVSTRRPADALGFDKAQVMHWPRPSARRPLVSSDRPAARAAGETRSPPRAAPWPGQAWPRRRPSGARSRRSASCVRLREISAQHNRRF
jgi:hypothetical protein